MKIFLRPSACAAWICWMQSGLMREILPEIEAPERLRAAAAVSPGGRRLVHTRIMLACCRRRSPLPLVFSVLFHDIGKPPTFSVDETGASASTATTKLGAEMTEKIMPRLRFPAAGDRCHG